MVRMLTWIQSTDLYQFYLYVNVCIKVHIIFTTCIDVFSYPTVKILNCPTA